MATGGGPSVFCEAKAVEDRPQRKESHEQDRKVKIRELGHGGRMTVCVGDEAQSNGANRDTHAHTELHYCA